MTDLELVSAIKRRAEALGFDIVRIARADPFEKDERIALQRIREGLMDGLPWYTEERGRRGTRPSILLENAQSIISVALSYLVDEAKANANGPVVKVGRYAWGDDYHKVIKKKLKD